jgi:hypothetical protein
VISFHQVYVLHCISCLSVDNVEGKGSSVNFWKHTKMLMLGISFDCRYGRTGVNSINLEMRSLHVFGPSFLLFFGTFSCWFLEAELVNNGTLFFLMV